MIITKEITPVAYSISKKVFDGKLTSSKGIKILVGDNRMNKNSAADYINNFKCLIEGKRFTRTNNAYSTEYFLEHILQDYGAPKLSNALSALRQHIDYYEDLQKVQMHKMRDIVKKYSRKINTVSLITNLEDLIKNISTIEDYFTDGSDDERLKTSKLIKGGICFIAYQAEKEVRFAPSKFLGYTNNTLDRHIPSETDGRDTNRAINNILNSKPTVNENLERKYFDYCKTLGINPSLKGGARGIKRKYWTITLEKEFQVNKELTGEFPEGKIVERTHKARERNSQVIEVAKNSFRKKHGRLFCQVCNFDFGKTYGQIGNDFIEGHHTIAVSEMPPDHKTKPEDIAMLCSNCHRMVHKKRPWLTMDDLTKLIK